MVSDDARTKGFAPPPDVWVNCRNSVNRHILIWNLSFDGASLCLQARTLRNATDRAVPKMWSAQDQTRCYILLWSDFGRTRVSNMGQLGAAKCVDFY